MADLSRQLRVERGGCVTSWSVVADTLLVERVDPPIVAHRADSVAMYTVPGADLCSPDAHYVHTHVANNAMLFQASTTDVEVAIRRNSWGLIVPVLGDGWRLTIYP